MKATKQTSLLYAVIALVLALPLFAQDFSVATGDPKGTYSSMFKQLMQSCSTNVPGIKEINTTGCMENIDQLLGNQVNAAWCQADVLRFRSQNEPLENIKTLIALYPEEVHFLALAQSKVVLASPEKGTLEKLKLKAGFGAEAAPTYKVFESINDLAGHRVGAAGGSYVTAQVIRLQGDIAYSVVHKESNDAVLAALNTGEIEAAVLVGGSPLASLKALGPDYKFLPVPDATLKKLEAVYRPAKLIGYPKMGLTSNGTQSVAVDAVMVTREYKTPAMV